MERITMGEFQAGVFWWRSSTDWPADFHNRDYPVLAAQNPNGRFDAAWWAVIEPQLTR